MNIIELEKYEIEKDIKYPFCLKYQLEDNSIFYIEPNFVSQLEYYKNSRLDDYNLIIEELIRNVKRNKKVIFTADFENPVVHEDDFIYQEIEDLTDPLKIFSGFKSFGSDYGD